MIKIIAVGSLKEKYLKSMVEDYYKRITDNRKELDLDVNMVRIRNENDFYYNLIVKFENLVLRLLGIRSINISIN